MSIYKTSPEAATTVADTLTFAAGSTQAIDGTLKLKGVAGKLLALRSSVPGAEWNLVPMGKTAASFVAVADSRNMGLTAIVATHSENGGDDIGWTFM